MQGTGRTYEVTGETTEWEDILINKKIITKEEVLLNKGIHALDIYMITFTFLVINTNISKFYV
jgi:hypothetical protein